jgi:hypothetical protein
MNSSNTKFQAEEVSGPSQTPNVKKQKQTQT